MFYRVSVQTDANFVQGSVRWPSATELMNVQSERWIRDPHLHFPDLSLTVSRDPVPGLLDLLDLLDLGLRLKWLSILGVRVGTPLRDLAKPFQTATEARAHCCFGCFRRLLWPIGDRGVCWTSNNINARCETILQVPSSICFAGEIQARTRIFLLWLCLWCSPWPQIFPSRILSMLFHFGLAQTYGKQLLLEVVFSTPAP